MLRAFTILFGSLLEKKRRTKKLLRDFWQFSLASVQHKAEQKRLLASSTCFRQVNIWLSSQKEKS
ncbi:CLUMA_CG011839, isoform A [Clunio marinus]|uniref:CLUMA_CG011839, isoform A n=1 Tax=Clunio marinus TaxID=568069 RepID=A0A1J1IFF4_9DIPT|nr:CLUMA_CG011839, isoform A [Clunio marinus]